MSKKLEEFGALYAAIGEEAARVLGGDPNGLFLYVEIEPGVVGASVFWDDGEDIYYFDPSRELFDALWAAWYAEDEDKRWSVLEYDVRGTQFDAQFKFPDEVDVSDYDTDRRQIALTKRYNNRPVIYPPIPDHFMEP